MSATGRADELSDLMARMSEAVEVLLQLADETDNATEQLRLEAKASGVRLAVEYVRAAILTKAAS